MIWELFPQHADKLKKGFTEYVEEHKIKIEPVNVSIEARFIEGYKYATDSGSGAHDDLTLYKPATASSPYNYVGVNGNDNTVLVVKELASKYGALRPPLRWQEVWDHRSTLAGNHYNCWIPVGPPGYCALGVYCRFKVSNEHAPSEEETKGFVVVHEDFCDKTKDPEEEVWTDKGSHAHHDLHLGRLPHQALWPSYVTGAGDLPTPYTLKSKYIEK